MWPHWTLRFCAGVSVLLVSFSAWAQQVVSFQDGVAPTSAYAGTRDRTLEPYGDRPWASAVNYDDRDVWLSGTHNQVGLLRWDLSAVPVGVQLTAVELELTTDNQGSSSYDVYEALVPWVAAEANWLQYRTNVAWNQAGAYGVNSDRGSTSLGAVVGSSSKVTVSLNAAGVAVVQAWLDGTRANHGFVIQHPTRSDSVSFRSSEHRTFSARPLLRLTWSGGSAQLQDGAWPTAAYDGTSDTTIANGPDFTRNLRMDGIGTTRRSALLKFDLSAIPMGAQVEAAELRLHVIEDSSETYPLYEVLRPWTEDGAGWFSWDGTNAWASPGAEGAADRGDVVLATIGPVSAGPVTVPLNAEGVARVQQWVDGSRPNNGFIFQDYSRTDELSIADRETTEVTDRPALVVTYVSTAPPTAVITPAELSVERPATVILDGSGSLPQPGASIAEYQWTQLRGPRGIVLTSAAEQRFQVDVPGLYVFRLVVVDSYGRPSEPTTATLTVEGEVDRHAGPLGGCNAAFPFPGSWLMLLLVGLRWASGRRVTR